MKTQVRRRVELNKSGLPSVERRGWQRKWIVVEVAEVWVLL
jgi:hypothetical protein